MSAWLAVGLLVVIAGAFALTVWLKCEGDRLWAERKTVTVTISLDTTGFVEAMTRMSRSMTSAAPAFERFAEAFATTRPAHHHSAASTEESTK